MWIFKKINKIKKTSIDTKFLHGNPNQEKTTGSNINTKIYYDRRKYKTISKVSQKRVKTLNHNKIKQIKTLK